MLERVVRVLICPSCGGDLTRNYPLQKVGGRLRLADLSCRNCSSAWGVRESVGLFGTPLPDDFDWRPDPGLVELPPNDEYWEAYLASLPEAAREALSHVLGSLVDEVRNLGGLLVDFATCNGHVLRRVAPSTGSQQLFLGLDPDLPRLYSTQAALRRDRRYGRVSLSEIDPRRWPLRDRSALGVVSFYGPSIVPHARLWFKEVARVLRPGAPFVFGTLLTEEHTLTVRQAHRLSLDEALTEGRLRRLLRANGLGVESWENVTSGESWPRNSYDPLPLEGDPWRHVLVHARRLREAPRVAPRVRAVSIEREEAPAEVEF